MRRSAAISVSIGTTCVGARITIAEASSSPAGRRRTRRASATSASAATTAAWTQAIAGGSAQGSS